MELESTKVSISICTICMNRLHHLKITLPKNIQDNCDYPEVNFILLDYSSTDELDIWVKEMMHEYLHSGKLVYYRYEHALAFHRTHSRNLAFKVASGEVICNVDADNYTGQGFAKYINEQFTTNRNIFLTTIDFFGTNKNYHIPRDVMGRICMTKEDFIRIGGFDERMINYGFEDYDLANRLEMLGSKRVLIEDKKFLEYIDHGDDSRFPMGNQNSIKSLYICYKAPWKSIILILFENQTFGLSGIIDKTTINADDVHYAYTKRETFFQHYLVDDKWHRGTWYPRSVTEISFRFDDQSSKVLEVLGDKMVDHNEKNTFYLISDVGLISWVSIFYIAMDNRIIMEQNLSKKTVMVNNQGFGEGKLTRNFLQLG